MEEDPRKLRKLASWYRELAERAGNPVIWHARLMTARDLEREADCLEKMTASGQQRSRSEVVEEDSGSRRNQALGEPSIGIGFDHSRVCIHSAAKSPKPSLGS